VVERPETLDEITVCCEPVTDGANPIALAATVQQAIHARIGVSVTVHVKAPGEIPRSEGKAVRVIDRR
jgi:phenylacetate-CoA ligase